MTSHTLQKLIEIKQSLDHLLGHADLNNQQEAVRDILKEINNFPITKDLIKQSSLGPSLASVKNKFKTVSPQISVFSNDIMVKWKKIMNAEASSSHAEPPKKVEKKEIPVANFIIKLDTKTNEEVTKKELNPKRKSVINLLKNEFNKLISDDSKATIIAEGIELAVNEKHACEKNLKDYNGKVQSLILNIRKNDALRTAIIEGDCSYAKLVNLTSAELANKEIQLARDKLTAEESEARISNWYENHRDEIRKDLGIEYEEWEYDVDDDHSEPDVEAPEFD